MRFGHVSPYVASLRARYRASARRIGKGAKSRPGSFFSSLLVLQEHGLAENGWGSWLEKTFAWSKHGEIDRLIGYMKESELLVEDQGMLGLGPKAEATLGRRNFLELMSAFTTPLLISLHRIYSSD